MAYAGFWRPQDFYGGWLSSGVRKISTREVVSTEAVATYAGFLWERELSFDGHRIFYLEWSFHLSL